jgi:uroporphyrinogen decarboxylase
MDKKKRVLAAIEGKMDEVDRPPVSVWYHFGTQFMDGRAAADVAVAFFRHYDFDFLKMMNDRPWPMPAGLASVQTADDLARFAALTMDEPSFREQLAALSRAARAVGRDAFVIETVFNPFGIARRTMKRQAANLMRESPDRFLDWLACCSDNLVRYVRAAAATGIGGVFFSVNGAEAEGLSDGEFAKFVRPFDLRVLEAAASAGPLLVGHVHGKRLVMDRVLGYPVAALNWSHLRDNPSIAAIRSRTGRCIIGGMDEIDTTRLTAAEIVAAVHEAARDAAGGGFMAGPGCAVPPDAAPELIRAPREAVEVLKVSPPRPSRR